MQWSNRERFCNHDWDAPITQKAEDVAKILFVYILVLVKSIVVSFQTLQITTHQIVYINPLNIPRIVKVMQSTVLNLSFYIQKMIDREGSCQTKIKPC